MSAKGAKKLRSGFTTGAAAAASTKGALKLLLEGEAPERVSVMLLTGEPIEIRIASCRRLENGAARCAVIKDAGDDPDVTHLAEIGATVSIDASGAPGTVIIEGGAGVGRVTKPGLEVPPASAAINPGPMRMIRESAAAAIADAGIAPAPCVRVVIDAPRGEILAEKTLNARLGILGGISILGTTGIVRPMSHDAYVATISAALSVARASGVREAVLTTGRRSERHAQALWPDRPEDAFIQIGDFFKASLEMAAAAGLSGVILAVFFGKAVKMAQGAPHTHAAKSAMTLRRLGDWCREATGDAALAEAVCGANTARHAFDMIMGREPAVVSVVGREMIASARRFAGPGLSVKGVIFGYDGAALFSD